MLLRVVGMSVFVATGMWGQDTTGAGSVIGVVNRAGDPVGGVAVCLEGTERCATSDAAGGFRIVDVRSGNYRLKVSVPGLNTFQTEPVEVRAGLDSKIEVLLPTINTVQDSVTVSESVFLAPEEVKNSSYLIQPNEVFKSAGALQDVARYVQTLPGVVIGSDDFRNDIIVRGGSPLENLFIVDNIEVPNINAFANFASAGGTVSLLDAGMIQDVTFLTGGYPAPFINRASSVLQVANREGNRNGFGGRATVGFAGAGTILEGPLKGGKGSWIVSARRSFLDFFTDDVGIGGVPVVYSLSGKAVYDLSANDRVWAANLTGIDRIRLGVRGDERDVEDELYNFDIRNNGWRSATGINWQRLFGARGVGLLGLTHSEASVRSTVRDIVRNGVPPPNTPIDQVIAGSPAIYNEDSREGESTVKYDLTLYAPFVSKLQTGGSFKIFRVNYTTQSPLGYDSPYSLTPGSNIVDLRRSFLATQTGSYGQMTRSLTSRLSLTIGARFDNYQYIGSSRVSPRAGLSLRITDKLSWRASYGTYYQQPFFQFLAAFPENRGLAPFRADHYVTGFTYVVNPNLRVTLEGYRKQYRDYPVSLQFPQLTLAGIGDTFDVRQLLFPMTSAGRGRAQGVELFVEKKFGSRWFGQANVAFARTRQAALDGVLRPGAFDYERIFNTVGGYRFNPKWEVSLRMAYLSGRPFTPFLEDESTRQNRAIFDLTRFNAERLRDYFRLDVRVDRTFIVRDKPLLVFFGLQNATNRQNVGNYSWNRRTNMIEFNDQLGPFPLIGMEWRF
jgi:hypothetical protein